MKTFSGYSIIQAAREKLTQANRTELAVRKTHFNLSSLYREQGRCHMILREYSPEKEYQLTPVQAKWLGIR